VIDADDVTIDLNGFTFSGGTGYGIMGAFVKNTEIRNGVVADWEKHGIDLGGSYLSRVIDVRAVNNSIEADYAGIKASGGSRVVGCIASSNHLGHGIWLSNGSYATVTDSVTEANGQDGIRVDGSGCVLRDNNSNGNVGAGLMVTGVFNEGVGNRVDGNQVTGNDLGIMVDRADNLIIKNSAYGNGTNYDIVSGNVVGPLVAVASGSTPWANFDY
jgi:parallel beta-helix repeat protein